MSAPVIIGPTSVVTSQASSMIFLHGLGDSSSGWSPLFRQLSRRLPNTRFILPTAPIKSVSLNLGMRMPAWYDIYSLDEEDGREDREGILASTRTVHELVEKERSLGVPSHRIFVGGFSQGGAVSLLAGLTLPHGIAGIVSLSAYLPLRTTIHSRIKHKQNIWMAHGKADEVVHYKWGRDSCNKLKEILGNDYITWKDYDGMTHSSCPQEVEDMVEWIKGRLADSDAKSEL